MHKTTGKTRIQGQKRNRDLRIIQTEGSETIMSKDKRSMKNDLKIGTWRTLRLIRKKEDQKVERGQRITKSV